MTGVRVVTGIGLLWERSTERNCGNLACGRIPGGRDRRERAGLRHPSVHLSSRSPARGPARARAGERSPGTPAAVARTPAGARRDSTRNRRPRSLPARRAGGRTRGRKPPAPRLLALSASPNEGICPPLPSRMLVVKAAGLRLCCQATLVKSGSAGRTARSAALAVRAVAFLAGALEQRGGRGPRVGPRLWSRRRVRSAPRGSPAPRAGPAARRGRPVGHLELLDEGTSRPTSAGFNRSFHAGIVFSLPSRMERRSCWSVREAARRDW